MSFEHKPSYLAHAGAQQITPGTRTNAVSSAPITNLPAAIESLREIVGRMTPITVHNTADYAEVNFGNGSDHRSQCMTMNPDDWLALNTALPIIDAQTARIAELEAALQDDADALEGARLQFVSYYQQHKAKGTDDGDRKAATNERFSFSMASALSRNRAALNGGNHE